MVLPEPPCSPSPSPSYVLLINLFPIPSLPPTDGVTPLMSAVCCGGVGSGTFQAAWLESPEPWEPLLGGGACPQAHTVGTGESPLHLAARFSRPTAAYRLLEAGANPNQPDQAGRTPLHTAVAADAREVCQVSAHWSCLTEQ